MTTSDQDVVTHPAPLTHAQAAFVDECRRYLAFIRYARKREDDAYARWTDGRLDAHHHNDARIDCLRAADEVDELNYRLDRYWGRRSTVFPDPSSAPRTLYDALALDISGATLDARNVAGWLDTLDSSADMLNSKQ